jgi:branched-chain amino acid transport system permease protein
MTRQARLRVVIIVLAIAALALLPLYAETYYLQLVTKILIMAIFAMSLDLLVGMTGLVSLGHAAFFGVGAYALYLMTPRYEAVSLWLSLPAAMLAAAALALVIGGLALRTSGVYFIMATLAFAQMLYSFVAESGLFGGYDGVYINQRPDASAFGVTLLDLDRTRNFYLFTLGVTVLVWFLLGRVAQSLFGRVIIGIRWNEHRMRSLGFPVFRYKLASFVIAGALGGLAGYLAAAQFGFVNPELFGWHRSGDVLMMVILGGMGTLVGPIMGAFVLVLVQEFLSQATKHWLLFMGGFVIAAVLFLPQGLAGLAFRPARPAAREE